MALLSARVTGSEFNIHWGSIDGGGGGVSSGGPYLVQGVVGQPDVGRLSSPEWSIRGGFLVHPPTPPAGVLAIHLNRGGYEFGILNPGEPVYTDRDLIFTEPMPDLYRGQTYILTRNQQKAETAQPFLTFSVFVPVTVALAVDPRLQPLPGWASDWRPRHERLETTDVAPGRLVYIKDFEPGTVELGPNRDVGESNDPSMYSVVILPRIRSRADAWLLYE